MNFLLYFLFFGSYTRKNALYHKARYSNTSFHFAANEKLGHSHYVDTFPSDKVASFSPHHRRLRTVRGLPFFFF